ncbi:MAG TPA: hypothetical protein VK846_05030 [Candidatus Limnocylindria bacterium]|nr:hypothetical protein [Candidatus Limnocylindria bacterium]
MQTKFSNSVAAVFAGMCGVAVASAHPGHAPTDFTAQVSEPFAGLDHFVTFAALTASLLLLLRAVVKYKTAQKQKTHK